MTVNGGILHRYFITGLLLALAALYGCDNNGPTKRNGSEDVLITADGDPQTSEAGGSLSLSVVLDRLPTANVTVEFESSDTSEGTVTPTSLSFTQDNWNAPQVVVVTGVDDNLTDGPVAYSIVVTSVSSDDLSFDGLSIPAFDLTNIDNDTAGVSVTPTSGLVTNESGGNAEFTVVLNAVPRSDVTIPVASSDPDEGTAGPASLTFTPENWNAPQTVLVTGVDDAVADGEQSYTIDLGIAVSDDDDYDGLDPSNVTVSNTDNDSAGITTTTDDAESAEDGSTAAVSIVLNSKPSADVVVAVASSDATEASASPQSLTFTSENWNAPQSVSLIGADDSIADGNQPYELMLTSVSSDDSDYDGLQVASVALSNVDDETAGFDIVSVSTTSDEDGGMASFELSLSSEPLADVVVALESSDISEGTLGQSTVTFTPVDWNGIHRVEVTGQNDDIADGDQPYELRFVSVTSTDANYDGIVLAPVALSNVDNDSAGLDVSVVDSASDEAGATAEVQVRLTSEPLADVTVDVSSSDLGEGTLSTSQLVFTTSDWGSYQIVTITGQDDDLADGNQPYRLDFDAVSSSDSNYDLLSVAPVDLVNTDDDSAGISVSPSSGLMTAEDGSTTSFDVELTSEPFAEVRIAVASGDTGEVTVDSAELVFDSTNWYVPQTVTLTGINDDIDDLDQSVTIALGPVTSGDATYAAMDPTDVGVVNADDDSAGVTVTPISGLETSEDGSTASFDVVLTSEPTADVAIAISSDDPGEGTVSPALLTFTSANWGTAQTVTVTGVDDMIADGDQPFTVGTVASSADGNYDGMAVADVSVTNRFIFTEVPVTPIAPGCTASTSSLGRNITMDAVDRIFVAANCGGQVQVMASDDAGGSFTAPVTTGLTTTSLMYVLGGNDGEVFLAALQGSTLMFVKSADAGLTWSAPATVSTGVGTGWLSMAVSGNTAYLAFNGLSLFRSTQRGDDPWVQSPVSMSAAFGGVGAVGDRVMVISDTPSFHLRVSTDAGVSFGAETNPPGDRKSTRLNSSHTDIYRMPSSA